MSHTSRELSCRSVRHQDCRGTQMQHTSSFLSSTCCACGSCTHPCIGLVLDLFALLLLVFLCWSSENPLLQVPLALIYFIAQGWAQCLACKSVTHLHSSTSYHKVGHSALPTSLQTKLNSDPDPVQQSDCLSYGSFSRLRVCLELLLPPIT